MSSIDWDITLKSWPFNCLRRTASSHSDQLRRLLMTKPSTTKDCVQLVNEAGLQRNPVHQHVFFFGPNLRPSWVALQTKRHSHTRMG